MSISQILLKYVKNCVLWIFKDLTVALSRRIMITKGLGRFVFLYLIKNRVKVQIFAAVVNNKIDFE